MAGGIISVEKVAKKNERACQAPGVETYTQLTDFFRASEDLIFRRKRANSTSGGGESLALCVRKKIYIYKKMQFKKIFFQTYSY